MPTHLEESGLATQGYLVHVLSIYCVQQYLTVTGSMIKHNHSDSVIAYYTTWYAVHSVSTYLHYPYIT